MPTCWGRSPMRSHYSKRSTSVLLRKAACNLPNITTITTTIDVIATTTTIIAISGVNDQGGSGAQAPGPLRLHGSCLMSRDRRPACRSGRNDGCVSSAPGRRTGSSDRPPETTQAPRDQKIPKPLAENHSQTVCLTGKHPALRDWMVGATGIEPVTPTMSR